MLPTSISGKSEGVKSVFKDAESLKREEWQRRRLLRFEQVRQQSKDIASLVRQKVQSEREKQLGLVQERVNARTQQWQIRKLKVLQSEYESSLQNVGKGHSAAARLPNEEVLRKLEAEKIMLAAQKRGQEALNRLRDEEAARRKADDERRMLFHGVKAVEEARSAAVVALPRPESTVGLKSLPPKPSVTISAPTLKKSVGVKESRNTLPEWPKRSWSQRALPLGVAAEEYGAEHGDSAAASLGNLQTSSTPNENHASLVVSSHGDTAENLKQIHTEDQSTEEPSKQSQSLPVRSLNPPAIVPDVELYDYSSCYQSQYDKVSGVVRKVDPSSEINAKEAADRAFQPQKKSVSFLSDREQKRSKEALHRVQVQRDYKDLMGSLSVLAKQNAALSLCHATPETPESKSKLQENQLKLAVENILQDTRTSVSPSLVDQHPSDTPDGSLVVSGYGDTPSSAPRLNLGTWHPPENLLPQLDSPKPDTSSTDSVVVAPAPATPEVTVSSRQQSSERDDALRNLVQRISNERQLLLQSNQRSAWHPRPVNESNISRRNGDQELRQLEERVLQQRVQLELQRSEVEHLDASIVVPDCMKEAASRSGELCYVSSPTHESIVIEHSHSDTCQDVSTSNLVAPSSKPGSKAGKATSPQKLKTELKSSMSSPTKDNMIYSMDVSMSSVIMDHSENSSSGSTSLSLHGVQVMVKVCGTEENSSGSISTRHSDEKQKREASELSSSASIIEDAFAIKEERTENPLHAKSKVGRRRRLRGKIKDVTETSDPKPLKHRNDPTVSTSNGRGSIQQKSKKPSLITSSKKEVKGHKKSKRGGNLQAQPTPDYSKERQEEPASTSTSYLSPPDRVLSSLTADIKTLIALAQLNVKSQSKNNEGQRPENLTLVRYINRLLAMSRESIDRLDVTCSEISTPSPAIFQSSGIAYENDASLSDTGRPMSTQEVGSLSSVLQYDENETLTNQDQIDENGGVSNTDFDVPSKPDTDYLPYGSAFSNQENLSNMTRQCHENISALTKMIEEVRTQAMLGIPLFNNPDQSSASPAPLDSTAYMSPPPQVVDWTDIAQLPQKVEGKSNRLSLDPYSAAVMQLLSDVRTSMNSKESESPVPPTSNEQRELENSHPKPPVAFWNNIQRCNVTSPIEPHELSTIPELATTLPESVDSHRSDPASPIPGLSPSSPGTPPDVLAELMRRKLLTSPFAWAKKLDSQSLDSNGSHQNKLDSYLSSGKTGTTESDISASKEANSSSFHSQNLSSSDSKNWKSKMLMTPTDLYSSADEVEGDLRRMGIGWVGAMLRKTKKAGALSSTSSSDGASLKNSANFKNLSRMMDEEPVVTSSLLVSLRQGRGHSTPIKPQEELSSSSAESSLV